MGHAHSLGRDADAPAVQAAHGDFEAVAHAAHDGGLGHTAVLQNQLGHGRAPHSHLILRLAQGQARSVPLHQECGHAAPSTLFRVGEGNDHEMIALLRTQIADKALAAVENVVIAVLHGFRAQPTGIGASAGLRQREGPQLPLRGHGQDAGFLRLGGLSDDDVVHKQVDRHDLRRAGAAAGDLRDDQHLADLVHPGSAVLLGDVQPHNAHLGQSGDQLSGEPPGLVDLIGQGSDLLFRKFPYHLTNRILILCQLEHN